MPDVLKSYGPIKTPHSIFTRSGNVAASKQRENSLGSNRDHAWVKSDSNFNVEDASSLYGAASSKSKAN